MAISWKFCRNSNNSFHLGKPQSNYKSGCLMLSPAHQIHQNFTTLLYSLLLASFSWRRLVMSHIFIFFIFAPSIEVPRSVWLSLYVLVRRCEGEDVRLMLWDTAGQEEFDAITKAYYRGAQACVLAFSSTDRSSFEAIHSWKVKVNWIFFFLIDGCDVCKFFRADGGHWLRSKARAREEKPNLFSAE